MKKNIIRFVPLLFSSIPLVALAAQTTTTSASCSSSLTSVADFFNFITCLISRSVIPLLFAVAIMIFVYGVMKYIANGADEAKREEGRKFMLWGIIAFFVMISVWGLVGILRDTFGVHNVLPQLPQ
jgi:hypothetical protein